MKKTHNNLVYNYLEKYNIPHANLGYRYLTAALLLCLTEPDYIIKTCAIYNVVAKRNSPATASQVERAMRHALSKMPTKITTGEFIARAVDEIFMDIHNEITSEVTG